jgi:hypothetical protein
MYQCPRCLYKTKQKNDLKKHFFKKSACVVIHKNIDVETLQDEVHKKKAFYRDEGKVITAKTRDTGYGANACSHCGREFSRKDNLIRHAGTCKFWVNKQIEKLRKENLILKSQQSININNIENQNIQININSYGHENIEYLSKKLIIEMTRHGTVPLAISKLIGEIHFNKKHPENSNLKLKNERSKYAEVFKQNKWKKVPKSDLIPILIHNNATLIEEAFEDVGAQKSTSHMRFDQQYYTTPGKFHKTLEKNTECFIINNTNDYY